MNRRQFLMAAVGLTVGCTLVREEPTTQIDYPAAEPFEFYASSDVIERDFKSAEEKNEAKWAQYIRLRASEGRFPVVKEFMMGSFVEDGKVRFHLRYRGWLLSSRKAIPENFEQLAVLK